jgi:hypothetical protein
VGVFVPAIPTGESNVVEPGRGGTGVLKLMVVLHGPIPTLFHVCTFQVKAPTAKFGVAFATEQLLALQTAEA